MTRKLDPLIILAVFGGLIFAGVSWLAPAPQPDRAITVDRSTLLTFIQFRMRAFDEAAAGEILDHLPPDEKAFLIDDYIREEMLYREARKMGFSENDYVIRRRLVQKVEFMNQSLIQAASPSDADLRSYWAAHQTEFKRPAHISFVHIFRTDEPDWAALKTSVSPQNMASQSHLFPYHLSYADRPRPVIEGDFGEAFAADLFAADLPMEQWVGPVTSEHGQHLVWVSARRAEYQPTFEDKRDEVVAAWQAADRQRQMNELLERLKNYYAIEFQLP